MKGRQLLFCIFSFFLGTIRGEVGTTLSVEKSLLLIFYQSCWCCWTFRKRGVEGGELLVLIDKR